LEGTHYLSLNIDKKLMSIDMEIKIMNRLLNLGFTIIQMDADNENYYLERKDERIKVGFSNEGVLCTSIDIDRAVAIYNVIQDTIIEFSNKNKPE
jgi:hypothetical protein